MIVVRYADDTIVGFQHEHEAKAFLRDLHERMREFELALHRAKTRLIRFGRRAASTRSWPWAANTRASAAPMPAEAPVITTT